MRKALFPVLVSALLAGCSWTKRSEGVDIVIDNPRDGTGIGAPAFALPGVPLKSDLEAGSQAGKNAAPEAAPLKGFNPEAAAPAAPAAVKPAAAAPEAPASPAPAPALSAAVSDEYEFHHGAAKKYAAKKQYRSAAAEYAAAAGLLRAGDAREPYLAERQGAMLLRAGDTAKAKERFQAAVARAGELGASGSELANAHLGLAYCLELENKTQDAITNYRKVLELSTSDLIKGRVARTLGELEKKRP